MTFIGFDPNTETWFPVPNGEIVFDEPGLITLLDPGGRNYSDYLVN